MVKPAVIYGVGVVLSVFGLSMFAWWPDMVAGQVNTQVAVTGTDSTTYDIWLSPNDPKDKGKWGYGAKVTFVVHPFNITNPDEWAQGAPAKLMEIGPYVYDMHMRKEDPEWNSDKTQVTYKYRNVYSFNEAESKGNPVTDILYHINPAIFATLDRLKASNDLQKFMCGILNKKHPDEMAYGRHTVNELLWGYTDEFLKSLGFLAPSENITVFVNDWDLTATETSTQYTGKKNSSLVTALNRWAGYDTLPWWGTDDSRTIQGSDGQQYHPNIKDGDSLMTYVDDLFRPVNMIDSGRTITYQGVKLKQYIIDPAEVANTTQRGRAYFQNGPYGVFNVSAVPIFPAFNSPSFVSEPYFIKADPVYREYVQFLNQPSDDTKLELVLNIEPTLGANVLAMKRFQINMLASQNSHCEATVNITGGLLPILYAEELSVPSPQTIQQLKDSLSQRKTGLTIGAVFGGVLVAVGIVMFFGGLLLEKKQAAQIEEEEPLTATASAVNTATVREPPPTQW